MPIGRRAEPAFFRRTGLKLAGLTVDDFSNKVVSDLIAADQSGLHRTDRSRQKSDARRRAHRTTSDAKDTTLSAAISSAEPETLPAR